jgi:hypothetical protein
VSESSLLKIVAAGKLVLHQAREKVVASYRCEKAHYPAFWTVEVIRSLPQDRQCVAHDHAGTFRQYEQRIDLQLSYTFLLQAGELTNGT